MKNLCILFSFPTDMALVSSPISRYKKRPLVCPSEANPRISVLKLSLTFVLLSFIGSQINTYVELFFLSFPLVRLRKMYQGLYTYFLNHGNMPCVTDIYVDEPCHDSVFSETKTFHAQ